MKKTQKLDKHDKKLSLTKVTVRTLDKNELERVAGGVPETYRMTCSCNFGC